MAVQKEILRRTFTQEIERYKPDGSKETVKYSTGTGALIGGVPGQIYDVAYGPVVHTTNLGEAADIGTFVENQGIIVNAPEYANYGKPGDPLAASLTCPANSVVSVMTAGHIWVKRSELAAIQAGMNTYIIYEPKIEYPEGATDEEKAAIDEKAQDDLCVVEVNGLLPADPGSDSNA